MAIRLRESCGMLWQAQMHKFLPMFIELFPMHNRATLLQIRTGSNLSTPHFAVTTQESTDPSL